MSINWPLVWERFEDWIAIDRVTFCGSCHKYDYSKEPEWPDQQKKIEQIVNALSKPRRGKPAKRSK